MLYVFRDALGIPTDAMNHRRRKCVDERHADSRLDTKRADRRYWFTNR
jgi:hypothetical protein